MKKKYRSLFPYRRAIPRILTYQVISKGLFALSISLYQKLTAFLMWSVDRPAFTSGDLPYLLRTWQGWLLVLLGFGTLVLYTVFDIHALVLFCEKLLQDEKIKVFPLLKTAFVRTKNLKGLRGVLVILYVALAAPLAGATFGISLTSDFVLPDFIGTVIRSSPILNILYSVGMIVLALLGAFYVFTFHFAVLGNLPVKDAMRQSRSMVKTSWKTMLPNYLLFILKMLFLAALGVGLFYLLPSAVLRTVRIEPYLYHAGIVFLSIVLCVIAALFAMLLQYFSMMKLTVYYFEHTGRCSEYSVPKKKSQILPILSVAIVVFIAILLSFAAAEEFDKNFPPLGHAEIIAHRGGGTLANENTVLSLQAAIEHDVYGSEIDVQRTADGHYIINHDADFWRCCHDRRKPGEMSLEEIKELEVINSQNPLATSTEVATMEEMLDAAKGKIHLFIELKGSSADEQMVRDIYEMIHERDMLSEITMISLNYGLIDYIESNYPEIETGYLCFFSFGDIATMHCDTILMEAEVASAENIGKIHAAGKKAGVWTVNMLNSVTSFMTSDIDYIITDEVALTESVRQLLIERNDEARVIAAIFGS